MKQIIIFTDGAVPNNQVKGNRKGGVGVFFGLSDTRNISFSLKESSTKKVTNQICELLACVSALETIVSTEKIGTKKIIIYTDSMYIVNSMNTWAKKWEKNDWKKADGKTIENKDIMTKLYYLNENVGVKFIHTKAHTKEPSKDSNKYFEWFGNFMADKLAIDAAAK